MKHSVLILLLLIMTTVSAVAATEQTADISLGRVKLRSTTQLDSKARRDVTAVAAKIKKMRTSGVIKVRGDFPGAATAAEYLQQSVFMASEVERYLDTLLSARFQVYATASGFSGTRRTGENSVEILLYPHQVLLEELDSLRFVSTRIGPRPVAEQSRGPVETVRHTEPAESGLLSPPREEADISDSASKRDRERRATEDVARANELVLKAKARAAEKAKRRAAEN